jgi:uncharacterized protein YndB with AHSA1/START domain
MSLLSKLFHHPKAEPPPPSPVVEHQPVPTPPPVDEPPPPAPDVTHRPAGDDPLAHWDRSVAIRTSRDEAWRALTTAETWGEWWAPVTGVEPAWTVGGRIHWPRGGIGTITRVQPGDELAFADPAGNWSTFRLSDAPDGRVRLTVLEDRVEPLSVQGAFDRHNALAANLSRLCTLLEPPVPYAWRLELETGGDTGSNEGPVHGRSPPGGGRTPSDSPSAPASSCARP